MQKQIMDAKQRLEKAAKVTDLSPENRAILCQLIELEIKDDLFGSYKDIPIQVYHHPLCPGYSSTTIKLIVEASFNHWAMKANQNRKALRFGSAFHAFCNEPRTFLEDYHVSGLESRRGNEYKREEERAGNRTIIMADEFRTIEIMSKKVFEHPKASELLVGAKFEETFFAKDEKTGLWMKCRLDARKGKAVSDLKSCMNASELEFMRDARKFLYRISGTYYLDIASLILKVPLVQFFFIACEKVEPWEIAVYRLHPDSMTRARDEIRFALDLIKKMIDEGEAAWRGYPLQIKEILI